MSKITFDVWCGPEFVRTFTRPFLPRVGELLWLDIQNPNHNVLRVKEVKYNMSVLNTGADVKLICETQL